MFRRGDYWYLTKEEALEHIRNGGVFEEVRIADFRRNIYAVKKVGSSIEAHLLPNVLDNLVKSGQVAYVCHRIANIHMGLYHSFWRGDIKSHGFIYGPATGGVKTVCPQKLDTRNNKVVTVVKPQSQASQVRYLMYEPYWLSNTYLQDLES